MITASQLPGIGNGTFVTYTGTPGVCTYWEVVSVLAMVEGAPTGAFKDKILVADVNGKAVNHYVSSTNPVDAGTTERFKVSEKL